MHVLQQALAEKVARCLGQRLVAWRPVAGGYSTALRLVVTCADGTSVFVKGATDTRTGTWLRTEYGIYSQVQAPFFPTMHAWGDDGSSPFLVLEDLTEAVWQTSWTTSRVAQMLDTLRQVAATLAPAWLPALEGRRPSLSGWAQVGQQPEPFLRLGLCSPAWLADSIDVLVSAEARVQLAGDELVYGMSAATICASSATASSLSIGTGPVAATASSMWPRGCRASMWKAVHRRTAFFLSTLTWRQ